MDLIKALRLSPCVGAIPSPPLITLTSVSFCAPPLSTTKQCSHFCIYTSTRRKLFTPIPRGRKRDSDSESLLEPSIVQELSLLEEEEEEEEFLDEYEYGKIALSLSNLIVSRYFLFFLNFSFHCPETALDDNDGEDDGDDDDDEYYDEQDEAGVPYVSFS